MIKTFLFHLCILSTILSSIVYVGFASLYHFFILVLVVFSLTASKNDIGIITATKKNYIMTFLFCWLIYSVISILYSPSAALSAQYAYYILLIYLYVWLFISTLNNTEKLFRTIHLFMFITTISCMIGLWEYFTGHHILKNYLDSPIRKRLLEFIPGFTYRNPNDFAMLLLQLLPFTFYGLLFEEKHIYKVLSFINIFMTLFVVSTTQSRTILIASLLYSAITLVKYFKRSWTKIFLGIIAMLFILQLVPQFRSLLQTAFDSISKSSITDSIVFSGGSGRTRINLFLNCILMLLHTGGFGVGAGCHRVYMYYYASKYFPTGHVAVAHNFFAEFLADYGIIMFLALIYSFYLTTKKISFFKKTEINERLKNLSFLLNLSICIFPLGAITLSSIIQLTSLWLTIGFIAAYIHVCEKEFVEISEPEKDLAENTIEP